MGILIGLFVTHFIADFLLQSREMGKKKSEEPKWLFYHLSIQLFSFILGLFFFHALSGNPTDLSVISKFFIFATLNTVIHGVIDWNVWRLYKLSVGIWMKNNPDHDATKTYKETGVWKYWEDSMFYHTIGFDQMLHSITIIVLWGLIL